MTSTIKHSLLILVAFVLTFTSIADVAHAESRLSISGAPPFSFGLEGEHLWTGTPWALAGYSSAINGGVFTGSILLRHTIISNSNTTAGIQVGLGQPWLNIGNSTLPFGYTVIELVGNHQSGANAALVIGGVFFEKKWEKTRIRISPSLSYFAPFSNVSRGWNIVKLSEVGIVGPPWIEFGHMVSPGIELSLRSSLTPLSVSMYF